MSTKSIYNKIARKFIEKTFSFWQMLGFHITPVHFYEPIPDTRRLKNDIWQKHREIIGIDMNEKNQIELLSSFVSKFQKEYETFPRNNSKISYQYYISNEMFESVDGEILYCMIRHLQPERIIEIGSGYSTYLAAQAILENKEKKRVNCELITIEPYPNKILQKGFPGLSKLIKNEVQNIPLIEFEKLKENDILFIDSSHVLKIGSDVQYEYLEILPRLSKGVIVHLHDIFLPAEYPKEWVLKQHRFYNEQYLLQTFLMFNRNFEILWAGSYMHLKYPELLKKAFNSYNSDMVLPSSLWIKRKAQKININNIKVSPMESCYKIAIIAPTPFHYHVPLYRQLTNAPEIDLTVFYCSDKTLRGAEVEKMFRSKGRIVKDEDLLGGYNYKFLKNYSLNPSYMRWPFGLINLDIWKEIKQGKYDAVIIQSWANLTWWLAFLACLRFNVPVLLMTDSNILAEQLRSIWRRGLKKILLGKFLFKRAAGFLTSGKANEEFYKAYGVPEEKMVRMPFSWGYEEILAKAQELKLQRENLRSSFGIKENDFVLLYVGRLSKEKSLFTLFNAYNRVNYQNKKLFLVGDGPLHSRLEKYAKKLNIKEIYFMGFQPHEEVFKFYTIGDVFILPSGDETWGIVVNEAMCFGLPIIASNQVGAAIDLVKEDYNGFLFPAGDSEKLTACIEKLISLSPEERLFFGKRSMEMITDWIKKIDPAQQILEILMLLKNKP